MGLGTVMSDYFKSALKNFTSDVAYGDEIRALAKKGMTVKQILANVTYPVSEEIVKDVVWKYYIQSGIISLEKPDKNAENVKRFKYVLERDECGRSSYRRVEELITGTSNEYIKCDFGKMLYNDRVNFMRTLENLDTDDRNYILGLPWPLETVYHIKDERMDRIINILK